MASMLVIERRLARMMQVATWKLSLELDVALLGVAQNDGGADVEQRHLFQGSFSSFLRGEGRAREGL